jgi:hypothetical protein
MKMSCGIVFWGVRVKGASLDEIGEVLCHRSHGAKAIYAEVDPGGIGLE